MRAGCLCLRTWARPRCTAALVSTNAQTTKAATLTTGQGLRAPRLGLCFWNLLWTSMEHSWVRQAQRKVGSS